MTTITIPDYPDKVLIAKARRAVYYVDNTTTKGKSLLPRSYNDITKYAFIDGVLHNLKTGEPVLANPRTAGKPRYWVVNFQDIWNGNMSKQARNNVVGKLKEVLRPHIKNIRKIKAFPVEISIDIYDTQCPVDISNRGAVYTKVIEDLLTDEGKIPDDKIDYVNCSGRTKFIKIDDIKNKRMDIKITKSSNKA